MQIRCALIVGLLWLVTAPLSAAPSGPFKLDLPDEAVSDRVSLVRLQAANVRETWAALDGPGCIRHIWLTLGKPIAANAVPLMNRRMIIRIYFGGSPVPHVEAPLGDFFGVMHGVNHYPINNSLLSVKTWSGYNCYFEMPFAKNARIELESGDQQLPVYMQVDWHRYPGQELREPRRFCAAWRREMPTARYGEDFLMLDATGPGQLIGFVYGVRLIDNVDRWSHGGAENIYLDGQGEHPAYIRGIGGEDTFGTSYGGALHPPETHLFAGMPYYTHEDTGEARVAQRLVGYRFFINDSIRWRESVHMRFGTMQNDVCATVYWYQSEPRRAYVKLPPFDKLLPGVELKRGEMDEPLPDRGAWSVQGPIANANNEALHRALQSPLDETAKLVEGGWVTRPSLHGFVDFNHVYRPERRGAAVHHRGMAGLAACVIDVPQAMTAKLQLAWDDQLVLRVNRGRPMDLGQHAHFRAQTVDVPLQAGPNSLIVLLSNEQGTNHGGWTFACKVTDSAGKTLRPRAINAAR